MTAKEFKTKLNRISITYTGKTPKREIFSLAKIFQHISVTEVVKLLKEPNNDFKLAAVSILDCKARNRQTSDLEKREIYSAYIENHNWINDWGLVDRAAPYVIGGFLYDKDRQPLYDLAKSKHPMERRTAIVSTYYFIRNNDTDDTFNIAEILKDDDNEYVQKAVGSWIREAGKRDKNRLKAFLDLYASTIPRITLRYAIEKFDMQTKDYYLTMGRN